MGDTVAILSEIIKHLPGRHDQKAHGRAGGKLNLTDMTRDTDSGAENKLEGNSTVESMLTDKVKPAYTIKTKDGFKYDIWKTNEGQVSNLGPWIRTAVYRRTDSNGNTFDSDFGYSITKHNNPWDRDQKLNDAYWDLIKSSLGDSSAIVDFNRTKGM